MISVLLATYLTLFQPHLVEGRRRPLTVVAGGGGGDMVIGNHAQGKSVNSAAISVDTPVDTAVSGSVFVVSCSYPSGSTFNSVTDNFSNTYVTAGAELTGTSGMGSRKTRVLYCNGGCTGGSSHTWTCNLTGSGNVGILAVELKNAIASNVLDQATQNTDTSSPFTSSITTTVANAGIVTVVWGDSGTTPATHAENGISGSTVVESITDTQWWTGAMAVKIVSSISTYAPSWTENGGASANVHVLNIKD